VERALAGNSDVHRWNVIVKSKDKSVLLLSTTGTVVLMRFVPVYIFAQPYHPNIAQ
jgi:hypothetical protein